MRHPSPVTRMMKKLHKMTINTAFRGIGIVSVVLLSLFSLSKILDSAEINKLHSAFAISAIEESNNNTLGSTRHTPIGVDKFGIGEIYPTLPGGREWYINMSDPKQDPVFNITDNTPISRQDDGSWLINDPQIRLRVLTLPGEELWKNVEMTGYFKVVSVGVTSGSGKNNAKGEDAIDPGIDMFARSTRHSDEAPCEGTAYHGKLEVSGVANWKKEIWHTAGYTGARGEGNVTNSIAGRWIGWKVAIYNINDNNAVKMESYLDDNNDGKWKKVSQFIDDGKWFATSSNKRFFKPHCGVPKDYIITKAGPEAAFRSDDTALIFKDLSIREIQPPAYNRLYS
jgi:hypothetical protein